METWHLRGCCRGWLFRDRVLHCFLVEVEEPLQSLPVGGALGPWRGVDGPPRNLSEGRWRISGRGQHQCIHYQTSSKRKPEVFSDKMKQGFSPQSQTVVHCVWIVLTTILTPVLLRYLDRAADVLGLACSCCVFLPPPCDWHGDTQTLVLYCITVNFSATVKARH